MPLLWGLTSTLSPLLCRARTGTITKSPWSRASTRLMDHETYYLWLQPLPSSRHKKGKTIKFESCRTPTHGRRSIVGTQTHHCLDLKAELHRHQKDMAVPLIVRTSELYVQLLYDERATAFQWPSNMSSSLAVRGAPGTWKRCSNFERHFERIVVLGSAGFGSFGLALVVIWLGLTYWCYRLSLYLPWMPCPQCLRGLTSVVSSKSNTLPFSYCALLWPY